MLLHPRMLKDGGDWGSSVEADTSSTVPVPKNASRIKAEKTSWTIELPFTHNHNLSFTKCEVRQTIAMEPLSVAASLVGLLAATTKVCSLLKAVNGASNLMQNVLSEVSDIRMSLGQLRTLLFEPEAKYRSRASLLMVEDIIVVLTRAVMTFSELEKVIEEFKKDQSLRVVTRLKLVLKQSTISKLLLRLQSSRASLSLMLTVLTCSSVEEAQASENNLNMLVQQVLESNQELSSRLASMESQGLNTTPSSVASSTSQDLEETDDDSSTIRPKNRVSTFSRKTRIETTENAQDLIKSFQFTFDQELKASRVYKRNLLRTSNMSSSSSVVPSMGWSFLSELSLADISNISTLSLPISPNELWNAQNYSLEMPACTDWALSTTSQPLSSTESSNARDYTLNESTRPSVLSDAPYRRLELEDESIFNQEIEGEDSENEVEIVFDVGPGMCDVGPFGPSFSRINIEYSLPLSSTESSNARDYTLNESTRSSGLSDSSPFLRPPYPRLELEDKEYLRLTNR